eukprot:snap_masked-scaffold_5-processed-gene-7.31-mRNA-1 protein AED:0.16 eAED:1.00 QI:0/-1/0/1/-1/1/1/0/113
MKEDKSIHEILTQIKNVTPKVPEKIIEQYIQRAGCDISPPPEYQMQNMIDKEIDLLRLLSLFMEKKIEQVLQTSKERNDLNNSDSKRSNATLTCSDLNYSLNEHFHNFIPPNI